jgi:N-methylhydantoinase B/oxoprolinase/acetone carboxylase alpha subunit
MKIAVDTRGTFTDIVWLEDFGLHSSEKLFPIRIARYALRRGSGGRGQFRGGDGISGKSFNGKKTACTLRA